MQKHYSGYNAIMPIKDRNEVYDQVSCLPKAVWQKGCQMPPEIHRLLTELTNCLTLLPYTCAAQAKHPSQLRSVMYATPPDKLKKARKYRLGSRASFDNRCIFQTGLDEVDKGREFKSGPETFCCSQGASKPGEGWDHASQDYIS